MSKKRRKYKNIHRINKASGVGKDSPGEGSNIEQQRAGGGESQPADGGQERRVEENQEGSGGGGAGKGIYRAAQRQKGRAATKRRPK